MIKFKVYIEESKKSSKEEAGYQDKPKNGEKCINCTMWRDPNKCSAVAGIISPNGWCDWYAGGAYGKKGKLAEENTLDEMLKQVKNPEGETKWAVVSKSDPTKVLQYYDGEGKPSKEWFNKVERRIQYFKHRG